MRHNPKRLAAGHCHCQYDVVVFGRVQLEQTRTRMDSDVDVRRSPEICHPEDRVL